MKCATACLLVMAASAPAGCATAPIVVGAEASGDAAATLSRDGAIRLKVRTSGPSGPVQGGVVTFRPGDPGYDALKAQLEAAGPAPGKPVLTWEIGPPVYER
jgi:hypothetical protein